jgi:leucyl-tRNA synthetase
MKDNLRTGAKNYHDTVFEEEMVDLVNITQSHYEAYVPSSFYKFSYSLLFPCSTNYKDALKWGFYDMQSIRDWYREVTVDTGLHRDLIVQWMRYAALLVSPIAPHFAEHLWTAPTLLNEPRSIQLALWPSPGRDADRTVVEAGAYMRSTIKMIRDAELALQKKVNKKGGKGVPEAAYDPRKPKSVRIYVATAFPEWQEICVDAVRQAYSPEADKVDDVKVREVLTEKGLIKDKRAMPFVQLFKVCTICFTLFHVLSFLFAHICSLPQKRMAQLGAQAAFKRSLPFSETQVLSEILSYLKRTLGLVDAEVLSVEEARQKGYNSNIIDTSEPGSPAFEYRNV